MGFKVLGQRDSRFQPIKGLEGPFYFANSRVLYYDPKEGQYYDPRTDFYVSAEEMDAEHGILVQRLVDFQR
jgi:hypothetical protein